MKKQFTAAWALVVSVLMAYLLLGILLTGEAAPVIGVLCLVLVTWFVVYKSKYKSLRNRRLITKMYDDLKGALERAKERIAQEEDQRRAAAEHEMQVHMNRERRRANRPRREDPVTSEYADMIENKVRKARQNSGERRGS